MRYISSIGAALTAIVLSSCGATYPTKAYGRAFVAEAYKQGFYSRSTYDWEMDRIARMNIPEGGSANKASIRNEVRNTFSGLAQSTISGPTESLRPQNSANSDAPTHGTGEVPSESFARQVFASKITGQSGGELRFVSFHKSDGMSSTVFGTQRYTMEGQLTFAAVVDTNWTGAPNVADETVRFGTTRASPERNSIDGARMFAMNETYLPAGSSRTLAVKIHFIRSERGWKLSGITR